jgi:hypothetical protein
LGDWFQRLPSDADLDWAAVNVVGCAPEPKSKGRFMTEQVGDAELLDWTSVKLYGEFVDGARLIVEGDAPVPMRVELHSLPIGVAPEEYQGIELRGFRSTVGPEVVRHFRVEADTKDLPHGTVGFVLIGATMREYVPPKDD